VDRLEEIFYNFHFLRPEWLWLLLLIIPILILFFFKTKEKEGWRQSISKHLLPHLIIPGDKISKWPKIFLLLVSIIMVLSIAGPSWEKIDKPGVQMKSALVIVLDLSRSMLVEDIQPNRLERAKQKISDLFEERPGTRTALIGFAGTAHVVLHFTTDYNAINYQLESLSPKVMPVQGTDLKSAIILADSLLAPIEAPSTVLIITDGIEFSELEYLKSSQPQRKNKIEFMALGTPSGGLISLGKGRYQKDKSGRNVTAALVIQSLKELASIKNINVTTLTLDNSDVQILADNIRKNLLFIKDPDFSDEDWEDGGKWLLFPVALIALFWFRRGWMVQWMFLISILIYGCNGDTSIDEETTSIEPDKFQFADLWFTNDQQGQRLYDKGDFFQAAEKYDDLMRRGVSYYRAGEFDKAKSVFALINSPQGYYNLGMAYAETGNLLAAKEAFSQALELYPDYEEAKENLEEIEKLIPKKKKIQLQEIYDTDSKQQEQSQGLDQKEDKEGDEGQQDGEGEKSQPGESGSTQQQDKDDMMFFNEDVPLSKEEAKDIVLRQLSSDPAVFLKRKFLYQFYKLKDKPKPPEKTW